MNPYENPKQILGDPRITDTHLGKVTRQAINDGAKELDPVGLVQAAAIESAKAQLERA